MAADPASDDYFMGRCLDLARRGAGHASPNPLVGCVIVAPDGTTLGEGWHAQYGGPHAEPNAIADALARWGGGALRGATLYVNLEPCAHWGKTPPCAPLVAGQGFRRVVVGMEDPFGQVAGRGLEMLRAAGVEVAVGVREGECRRLNEAFTHHVITGRPLVVLKVAQTLDGFAATPAGHSQWVTGEAARRRVHALRGELDAVLVGAGTARADNPALTVRHVAGRQPRRVVLDRAGQLPPSLQLFTDAWAAKTIAVVAPGAAPAYAAALRQKGGEVLEIPEKDGRLDLAALLDALGAGRAGAPVQSLLVEAGPGLGRAFFEADLVDRFLAFVAPALLGGGLPAVSFAPPDRMDGARRWAAHTWETVGDDVLFTGYRRAF